MKRWVYIFSGMIIGIAIATTGSAFADQVNSLIGKKVTGEYTVIVNGKALADKGAVIDGKTNAPVRALSEALGADVKVEGKTIIVNREVIRSGSISNENPFIGQPIQYLKNRKDDLVNDLIKRNKEGLENAYKALDLAKIGSNQNDIDYYEKSVSEYETTTAKYTKELNQINEALAESE